MDTCDVLGPSDVDLFDLAHPPSGLGGHSASEHLTRWFCQHCGTHLVQSFRKPGQESLGLIWSFARGVMNPIVTPDGRPTSKVTVHHYVNYALDGGMTATFMQDGAPRYKNGPPSSDLVAAHHSELPSEKDLALVREWSASDSLPVRCLCGNVDLVLKRPSFASLDSLPDKTKARLARGQDTGSRWKFNFCLCNSCRVASGQDLSAFVFCPLSTHVFCASKDSIGNENQDPRTRLSRYDSYPEVHRYFCPTCGCKVFFCADDRPGDICDIFAGTFASTPLLSLLNGWTFQQTEEGPGYWDFARDKHFAESFRRGYCPNLTAEDLKTPDNVLKLAADYNG